MCAPLTTKALFYSSGQCSAQNCLLLLQPKASSLCPAVPSLTAKDPTHEPAYIWAALVGFCKDL